MPLLHSLLLYKPLRRARTARANRVRVSACVGAVACIGLALILSRAAHAAETRKPPVTSAIAAAIQDKVLGLAPAPIRPGHDDLFAAILGRGIELLGACALAAAQLDMLSGGTDPGGWWIVAGKIFLTILFVGIIVALWRSRPQLMTRDAVPLLLLTVSALLLRAIANGGPADIREVIGDVRRARGGFVVFSQLVYAALPPIDESIWAVNRLCGALSVPLLYAVVRKRFADPL